MPISFGAKIRELRKGKALTLRELADRTGVSTSYLSKIENERGDYQPREKTIRALADALDVDPERLILQADKIPGGDKVFAGNPAAQEFLREVPNLTEKDWHKVLRAVPPRGGRQRLVTLATGTNLKEWAKRLDAQNQFPRLIRDLVRATATPPASIDFRSGEGIQLPGWDGRVSAGAGAEYVPEGESGWELTTRQDTNRKADQDYDQRKRSPGDLDPANSTFVFATLRRWKDKRTWAKARSEEHFWGAVRGLDADDIEAWLDSAPVVHDRISRYLGFSPEGSRGLETYWRNLTESTDPPITAKIVVAGREQAVKQINDRLQGWVQKRLQTIEIRAASPEEGLALFAAAVDLLPVEAKGTVNARAIVVESLSAWRNLVGTAVPIILIPRFNPKEDIAPALKNGHLTVLLLTSADDGSPSTIRVDRLSREAVTTELISSGTSEKRARELGTTARRGFHHLMRELALHPAERPAWARSEAAIALAPLLLAGAWSDTNKSDQGIISELTGRQYRELSRELARLANEADPPIRLVKDRWSFVSHQDAWKFLAANLTNQDLERMVDVARKVLTAADPAFDLPDSDRWKARVVAPLPRYSDYLREGFCGALALAGTFSSEIQTSATYRSGDYSDRAVREVLEAANADWKIWASLSRDLTLLAEAAPDQFLQSVLAGLDEPDPALRNLFRDTDGGFFNSSPHPGLLWALEILAWDPEYLGQATLALGRLAQLDPGGNLGNRPQASLRGIFLPWHPQTHAGLEQKYQAIDGLVSVCPGPGWRLLCDTLPEGHSVGMNTPVARFRKWGKEEISSVTRGEYARAIQHSVDRILELVGNQGDRWADVIEVLPTLSIEQHRLAVSQLSCLRIEELKPQDRALIWHALRKLLAAHRSFADADWAMPKEQVEILAQQFSRFIPSDLIERYAWLFSHNPDLPEGRDRDWDVRDQDAEAQRRQALQIVFDGLGLEGIFALVARAEEPRLVGLSLGRMRLFDAAALKEFLRTYLGDEDPRRASAATAVCTGAALARGREWLEQFITVTARTWTAPKRVELLLCLQPDSTTWDLVEGAGSEVAKLYWGGVGALYIPVGDSLRAIENFLSVARSDAAAVVAYRAIHSGAPAAAGIVARILEAVPETRALNNIDAHMIGELLGTLQPSEEVPEDRIAGIEWLLLPLIEHGRHQPRFLLGKLAKDPAFYIDVLSLVYRGEDEEKKEIDRQDRLRALMGHTLLEKWRTPPGTELGGMNRGQLFDWVKRARQLARDRKRGIIADQMIGQMLSGCPTGSDGIWPHEVIRDLLDDVASTELERGFQLGRFNSRGVVSKAMFEGGVKERSLAEGYKSSATRIANRWPRAAGVLRRMADSYEDYARREDSEAQLREDDLT